MKIYTKTGDKGQTSLYDGSRIDKDSIRVEAYGTIDELNSYIGLCINYAKEEERAKLLEIQKKLFSVGGELATLDREKFGDRVLEEDVTNLEVIIDEYTNKIEKITSFIVPGTSLLAANLHIARTICRRAERRVITLSKNEDVNPFLIKYVNRLSDLLYIIARYSEEKIIPIAF